MSSNISNTLPKKYDNPSIKVRETSADLDERKKTVDSSIIKNNLVKNQVIQGKGQNEII